MWRNLRKTKIKQSNIMHDADVSIQGMRADWMLDESKNDVNQTRSQSLDELLWCNWSVVSTALHVLLSTCYNKHGTVDQWLALSPHSEKVLGLIPTGAGPFCVEWSLHVLPVSAWVFPGCSGFPLLSKTCTLNKHKTVTRALSLHSIFCILSKQPE